ncbi:hypothetical protein MTR_2g461230 [Medicago truncatula]|uniref:DUF4219 domain-containing protein n=1 Tax=Medicago truncatula TaxID=3880 RepID=A0A072V8Y8_MEDTR|nr:hypothetical protein MTR_2g461230 [Medicago truncatula]
MNGNNSFNTHLPILEGGNWERWSVVMKNLFGAQDLLDIVRKGYEDLEGNATETQKELRIRNIHKWSQLHKHIKREGSCPGTPCRSKREDSCPGTL